MKKNILFRLFYLSSFLVLTSFNNATSKTSNSDAIVAMAKTSAAKANTAGLSATIYEKLNLQEAGLSQEALEYAIKGYEKLKEEGVVQNTQYLTIADLSQSSRKKRLYILDLENNRLALNTFVAHGKNSGIDQAERFSNIPESEKTSLGFYVTEDTYSGKHGLSLKLKGLEEGFNNNAESRAIVVHGASYVNESRVRSAYMGRSQGCPAVPQSQAKKVISLIKGGSTLFVYHPDQKYVTSSKILNG